MKKILFLMPLLGLLLSACSSNTETPSDVFKGQTAEQIYQGGEKALAGRSYDKAIKNFEGLDALYPFSPYEEQAQLDLIYAYYKAEDYASSAATADRFTRLYPRGAHVDYAYFMKGVAHFQVNRGFATKYFNLDLAQRDLSNANQAFNDFAQLIEFFPDSPYVPNARARMITLRNLLAQHEVEVANYYMKHQAYLAAVNRANYVIEHYQTAPAVIEALGVLVEAYRALNMKPLADQTLSILQYNFPNSETYKRLAKAS